MSIEGGCLVIDVTDVTVRLSEPPEGDVLLRLDLSIVGADEELVWASKGGERMFSTSDVSAFRRDVDIPTSVKSKVTEEGGEEGETSAENAEDEAAAPIAPADYIVNFEDTVRSSYIDLSPERIAEIDADLELLDKIGATKFTPHTDTIYQMLEQEKLDLTQPRSPKDDKKDDDGPETIVEELMAAQQTIQDRDETDIFDLWDRIKSNQAKRAMLKESGIIQDNTQEETMMLNSGGLANLFRVKTQ